MPSSVWSRRWLNQSTHSRVSYSTSSRWRQGPRHPFVNHVYGHCRVGSMGHCKRIGESMTIHQLTGGVTH